MHNYGIILYWSNEDQVFVAEVPELPGCMAHGDTHESALVNAKEAIQLWIDTAREFDDAVPESKGKFLHKYEIIIYWSNEDRAFIAEAPELPGCMADGETHREALSNLDVVIGEWIEAAKESGRPIPQPKGRLMFA